MLIHAVSCGLIFTCVDVRLYESGKARAFARPRRLRGRRATGHVVSYRPMAMRPSWAPVMRSPMSSLSNDGCAIRAAPSVWPSPVAIRTAAGWAGATAACGGTRAPSSGCRRWCRSFGSGLEGSAGAPQFVQCTMLQNIWSRRMDGRGMRLLRRKLIQPYSSRAWFAA